jgi:hypothetical protein
MGGRAAQRYRLPERPPPPSRRAAPPRRRPGRCTCWGSCSGWSQSRLASAGKGCVCGGAMLLHTEPTRHCSKGPCAALWRVEQAGGSCDQRDLRPGAHLQRIRPLRHGLLLLLPEEPARVAGCTWCWHRGGGGGGGKLKRGTESHVPAAAQPQHSHSAAGPGACAAASPAGPGRAGWGPGPSHVQPAHTLQQGRYRLNSAGPPSPTCRTWPCRLGQGAC